MKLAPGTRLGPYEILSLIGVGGMGEVYKARDTRLDRVVALKFLSRRLHVDEEARMRFEREAKAISTLNHPNIAIIYDVDLDSENPYLVLEYLPGGTLLRRIRDQKLPLEEICLYARQLGLGLAHAHRNGVTHRDVKPANALFAAEGPLKIVDFGVSKLRDSTELTAAGVAVGTATYMAPEQALTAQADHRADLFAFGVILYEMAAGKKPFDAERREGLLHQLLHMDPPPLAETRPDLPERFAEIVRRAMEKQPENRYQTAEEMVRDLEAVTLAAGLPVFAGGGEMSTQTVMRAGDSTRIVRPSWRLRVRQSAAVVVIVLALLVAGVLAVPRWRRWLAFSDVPSQKQLIVLPFDNVGNDPANQVFCDGLVEVVTSLLSQMEQFQKSLWVVPTGEARRLSVRSVQDARRTFNVNLALTGSVLRSENELRVIVNLVDAATVRQLASRILPVPRADAAALQRALLAGVVELLELEMTPRAGQLLASTSTASGGAYELYLQGQGYLRQQEGAATEQAIGMLQQSVERDPNYALAHASLAEAYLRKFSETKDRQWLAQADVAGTRAAAINDGLAPVHSALGLVRRATGQYEEAIREFRRAIALDPANVDAHRFLATTLESAGRIQEAEATFQQAIRLKPGYWPTYSSLGGFYVRRGQYAKAEEPMRLSVKLAPENPLGYRSLGGIYHLLGRHEEAIRELTRSLELKPTGDGYSNLGVIHFFQGRYAAAVEMFEKSVQLNGNDTVLWYNLGDGYWQLPDGKERGRVAYRKAIELGERALEVNPRLAELRGTLAICYARLDEPRKAHELITAALETAPQNVNLLFKAARVHEISGDRERALRRLGEALAQGYSPEEVRREPDLARLRADPRFAKLKAQERRP